MTRTTGRGVRLLLAFVALTAGLSAAATAAAGTGLQSGKYAVTVLDGGFVYQFTWTLKATGGAITGTSVGEGYTDPLSGSVQGTGATIIRHCGPAARAQFKDCDSQTYVLHAGAGGILKGTATGFGIVDGTTITMHRVSATNASIAVSVEAAAPNADVGAVVGVTVKVTAGAKKLNAVSLGKGLIVGGEAATVTSTPAGLSGFSLDASASRTFTFKVKGAKEGTVTLSVSASAEADSGTVHGSGEDDLTVGGAEIVVNTTADGKIDPKALAASPPRCAIDAKAKKPECSLRAAVQLVNKLGGNQSIGFDIPGGGVPRIAPASALPPLTVSVSIDGTTQAGGWVELSGAKAGDSNGLELEGGATTVRGLVINGFAQAGIYLAKGRGDVIAGNRIGSNPAGGVAVPNGSGVYVAAGGATIGGRDGTKAGTCAGDCNLLSGNSVTEVEFGEGGSGQVIGNTIGPDLAGEKVLRFLRFGENESPLAHGLVTVRALAAGRVVVGGATSAPGRAPGNLIAGGHLGITFGNTAGGVVAGNLIGLDRSGTRSLEGEIRTPSGDFPAFTDRPTRDFLLPGAKVPPFHAGVYAVSDVLIGGRLTQDANVISGFPHGVYLFGDNLVEHDLIGTNATGTAAIGNLYGVYGNGDSHGLTARVVDSVVSGNLLTGVSNVREITGSRIGTNADGSAAVPNGLWGVEGADSVGGVRPAGSRSCSGPCNLISGNELGGVSGGDKVEGNFVGTDLAGTRAIPNGGYWQTAQGKGALADRVPSDHVSAVSQFSVLGGPSGAVRGVCDRACNLISGNDQPGAQFVGGLSPSMEGNMIGRSATGKPLPNHGAGVQITLADKQGVIGGDGDSGNLIADNLGPAIELPKIRNGSGTDLAPTIQGNSITGNQGGILYAVGTKGPGKPEKVEAVRKPDGSVNVFGLIPNFSKGKEYKRTIELFGDTRCQPGPQGAVPVGKFTLTLISPIFNLTASGIAKSLTFFTVTDTYEGSTSTFSNCARDK